MASNRKYRPLIPHASLSVGSSWPHSVPLGYSTWPDQARIPTGNDVRPFEFRIQQRQKTRLRELFVADSGLVTLYCCSMGPGQQMYFMFSCIVIEVTLY